MAEVIRIHGIDFYYLPRTLNNKDEIYESDDISTFEGSFLIEMYVNWANFSGEGTYLSRIGGLEIRDTMNFVVARKTFEKEIQIYSDDIVRPREGDLIYYPLNKKLFEIKFVNDKPIHYPMGILPMYELSCELYEYADQRFDTGIDEIDDIQAKLSKNMYDYALLDDQGRILVTDNGDILVTDAYELERIDPLANNNDFNPIANDVIDWSEENPFGEIDKD